MPRGVPSPDAAPSTATGRRLSGVLILKPKRYSLDLETPIVCRVRRRSHARKFRALLARLEAFRPWWVEKYDHARQYWAWLRSATSLRTRRDDVCVSTEGEMGRLITRRQFLRATGYAGVGYGLIVVAGCSEASPGTTSSPAAGTASASVAGPSRARAMVTIGMGGDISSLDPHKSQQTFFSMVNTAIWETLVRFDPHTLQIVPALAKSFSYVDPVTLGFQLPDGVQFHSGDPLTAADVKYSIDRVRNPDTGSPFQGTITSIDRVDVVDEHTVRMHLSDADPSVVGSLHKIRILSAKTASSVDTQPNGTGPFKFVKWNTNDSIQLARNANYRVADKPLAAGLNYRVLPQEESRVNALKTGEIEILILAPLQNARSLGATAGIKVYPPEHPDVGDCLYINVRKGRKTADQRLRQALAYAFDKGVYFSQFLYGYEKPNMSPHDPASWAYDAQTANAYPFSLDRARALLADAGYPNGKGLNLDFIFPNGYPQWNSAAQMLQANIAGLGGGGTINVLQLETATWLDRLLKTRDFDLTFANTSGAVFDPAYVYATALAFTPRDLGITGWDDPNLEALIADARKGTQSERQPKYVTIQRTWNERMYSMVLGRVPFVHAALSKVSGWTTHPTYEQDWTDVTVS